MARTVQCIKLGKAADGLDFPPYPGELGKRGGARAYLHEVLAAVLLDDASIVCRRGRHRLRRQDQPTGQHTWRVGSVRRCIIERMKGPSATAPVARSQGSAVRDARRHRKDPHLRYSVREVAEQDADRIADKGHAAGPSGGEFAHGNEPRRLQFMAHTFDGAGSRIVPPPFGHARRSTHYHGEPHRIAERPRRSKVGRHRLPRAADQNQQVCGTRARAFARVGEPCALRPPQTHGDGPGPPKTAPHGRGTGTLKSDCRGVGWPASPPAPSSPSRMTFFKKKNNSTPAMPGFRREALDRKGAGWVSVAYLIERNVELAKARLEAPLAALDVGHGDSREDL